jgi:hypothetical protein
MISITIDSGFKGPATGAIVRLESGTGEEECFLKKNNLLLFFGCKLWRIGFQHTEKLGKIVHCGIEKGTKGGRELWEKDGKF